MSDQNPIPGHDGEWQDRLDVAQQHTLNTFAAVRQEMMQEINNRLHAKAARSTQSIIDSLMDNS